MSKRNLFVLGLLSVVLMLAVASPAFATTRHTRITGLSKSPTTSTYKDTGRVTYSKSGHYYSVSRAYVKVYRYIGGHWVYHSHIHATTSGYFKVSEPAGYSYKFSYAGKHGHYASTYATVKVVRPANAKLFSFVYADNDVNTVGSSETTAVTGGAAGYTDWDDEETGRALVGATVKFAVLQADETYLDLPDATTTTDVDGSWTTDLPVGDYVVSIDAHTSFSTVGGVTYDLVDGEYPAWPFSVVK